ncbi:MAG: molybdopterin molybdenumtransferase MoeA, partial [Deltaproteobacteria bacterium]|nr:molybdopterin molybdenumtransferase MoeA [Deltaproteobacteria bacterium]
VRPALLRALGAREAFLPALRLPLAAPFQKKTGLRHFLKARAEFGEKGASLHILAGQGSHLMRSFAEANALAVFPEEVEALEAGALVETHLLPAIFQHSRGG